MILEDYEKTNYATEDHSLVKFLVGDTTDLIPISNVTLSRDEWVSDYSFEFKSYHSIEAEKQLVKSLQEEEEDREIMEALAKHFKK